MLKSGILDRLAGVLNISGKEDDAVAAVPEEEKKEKADGEEDVHEKGGAKHPKDPLFVCSYGGRKVFFTMLICVMMAAISIYIIFASQGAAAKLTGLCMFLVFGFGFVVQLFSFLYKKIYVYANRIVYITMFRKKYVYKLKDIRMAEKMGSGKYSICLYTYGGASRMLPSSMTNSRRLEEFLSGKDFFRQEKGGYILSRFRREK